MSRRIARADLDAAFNRLKIAAIDAGFDADRVNRWDYSIGSRTYGNTFRLYQFGANQIDHDGTRGYGSDAYPYGSGHYSTDLPEFLGWTKQEAFDTMQTIISTLWAVHRVNLRA